MYISNYKNFLNENKPNYAELFTKKVNPNTLVAASSNPIEGGVVLIFSNKIFNGKRRIYMSLINKIREDNKENTVRVDLTGEFYILKYHPGNLIMPEKIGYMSAKGKKEILNMNNNGLYLNENKTPLWQSSSECSKLKFFSKNQELLSQINEMYGDVEIPGTSMRTLPNLH